MFTRYEFVGGPLDGHVGLREGLTITTWPDGQVHACVDGVRDGYWLLYTGRRSFADRPKLSFGGYVPICFADANA